MSNFPVFGPAFGRITLGTVRDSSFNTFQMMVHRKDDFAQILPPVLLNELAQRGIVPYLHVEYQIVAAIAPNWKQRSNVAFVRKLLAHTAVAKACVVIHCGTATNGGTIDEIVAFTRAVTSDQPAGRRLLLENAAGQGKYLVSTWLELVELAGRIDHERVGLCLDTAHAFGAGLIDWRAWSTALLALEELNRLYHGVALVHMNDSKADFKSKKDKHECLGKGLIWQGRTCELKQLLRELVAKHIPMILESPENVMSDYDHLRELLESLESI